MARPTKESGIEWFPHPTRPDRRIQQLRAEHPQKGYECYYLLMEIICSEGYFIEWNSRQLRYWAKDFMTDADSLTAIIETCLAEGLFNQELFTKYQILTSFQIQEFYLNVCTRRTQVIIVKEFALFSDESYKSLRKIGEAFFRVYDNINLIISGGVLVPDWKNMGKLEPIPIPELPKKNKADPDQGELDLPPLEPVGANGRQYGDPAALPMGFDWEADKQKLLDDVEWKTGVCTEYNIGLWSGKNFKPDFKTLDKWLQEFFQHLFLNEDTKTVRMMKGHFRNWYPKRESLGGKVSTLKSNLHVGKQDYEGQTTWSHKKSKS